ncbi:MAG: exosome complex protein Rrp42 [Nanoarchaeota archaeon]|nr:exosome complex protein Rrp42 [Nanoarchaeota archaeon]
METPELTGNRMKKYLEGGKRFDGRGVEEYREMIIETGVSANAEGSARVKLGKTEVLVGIKMGVGEPYPDSQDKGNLMVTAELLPLSSSRYENGPPKFPAIELGRVTDRIIRESKFIELNKLVIKEGEKVWTVFVDIYSINDDGNLLDAAGIGAIAALKTAKIPKYDEKEGKVLFGEWTTKNIPLSKETPISITLHKIGNRFVVDPTLEEEDIAETRLTIGRTKDNISSMQKGNPQPISIEDLHKAIDLSEKMYTEVFKRIEKVVK